MEPFGSFTLPRGGSHGIPKYLSPHHLAPLIPESTISTKSPRPVSAETPQFVETPNYDLKLRYGFQSLTLICISSVFFSLISVNRMENLERVNVSGLPRNDIQRVVWEASLSVALATLLSAIAAFFVASLQIFFALKIANSNPGSAELAVRFLQNGKLIRLPTFFIFFFTVFLFLISFVISLFVVPMGVSAVQRGVICVSGLALCAFCSASGLHSIHSLFRLDSPKERYRPIPTTSHYSTLV